MRTVRRLIVSVTTKIVLLSLFCFLMARGACPAWFLGLLVACELLQGVGHLLLRRHLTGPLAISRTNTIAQAVWILILLLDVTHPQFRIPPLVVLFGFCFLSSLQLLVFFRYLFRVIGVLGRLFPLDLRWLPLHTSVRALDTSHRTKP